MITLIANFGAYIIQVSVKLCKLNMWSRCIQTSDLVSAKYANIIKLHQIFIQFFFLALHIISMTFTTVLFHWFQPRVLANRTISRPFDPHRKTFDMVKMVTVCPEVHLIVKTNWASTRCVENVVLTRWSPLATV